jgi:hypothetical protein
MRPEEQPRERRLCPALVAVCLPFEYQANTAGAKKTTFRKARP